MLEAVSRTFALTIPQLPPALAPVVSNAYLLCRITDTLEDEPALSAPDKRRFCDQFAEVVAGSASAERFARELAPRLTESTIPAEHELIRETPRVIAITQRFTRPQRDALVDCIRIMGDGMAWFQEHASARGLTDLAALDRYCYYVAGVVGEMLTRLFCEYSPVMARLRDTLMPLSVSFGQGLQMTNILKDVWEDLARGACWLPRDLFANAGFDLDELAPGHHTPGFDRALRELIGVAHGHLKNALHYTLLIPSHETGIRNFCLWAIGMAVLTLRKIDAHRDFQSGGEVKISRRAVQATVMASRLTAAHDLAVKTLFRCAGIGLPLAHQEVH